MHSYEPKEANKRTALVRKARLNTRVCEEKEDTENHNAIINSLPSGSPRQVGMFGPLPEFVLKKGTEGHNTSVLPISSGSHAGSDLPDVIPV